MAILIKSDRLYTDTQVNGKNKDSGRLDILDMTLPRAFNETKAIVYHDEVHLFSDTYHYKWNGKKWVYVSALPKYYSLSYMDYVYTTANGARYQVFNDKIVMYGATSEKDIDTPKHTFVFNGSNWSESGQDEIRMQYNCGVVFYNKLWTMCCSDSFYNTSVYAYNGNNWVAGSSVSGSKVVYPPYSSYYSDAVVYNDEIHIFGGTSSGTGKNHYVFTNAAWSQSTSIPENFNITYGKAIVFDNKIYLVGCANGTKVCVWDGSSWTTQSSTLEIAMAKDALFVLDNKLYRAGGEGLQKICMEYNNNSIIGYSAK